MIIGRDTVTKEFTGLAAAQALGHAYLFYGPAMAGKRTFALALAHFLEKGSFTPPADGEVLQDGMVIDAAFAAQLDPDKKGGSIGIDAVRAIREFLWQRPIVSPRRTLILDDAERMTSEAQNAILKIAEEPPASSLIILIASDPEGLLPTILSRVEKIYFGTVPEGEIAAWLAKERKFPAAEAKRFAARAFGRPGLALRLTEDMKLRTDLELAEKLLTAAPSARRDLIKEILEPEDFDLPSFLAAMALVLAGEKPGKTRTILWHRVLALSDRAAHAALNPRLQLEGLFVGE
jgi:replication-associated recombination protein RarA